MRRTLSAGSSPASVRDCSPPSICTNPASKSVETLEKIGRNFSIASPSSIQRRYLVTKTRWTCIAKTQCLPCRMSLKLGHRPNHNGTLERRQAFQFELLPIGDHRVAGSASPLRPRVNQPFALAANEVFLELRISDLQALAGRLNRQVWEAGSANDPVCS